MIVLGCRPGASCVPHCQRLLGRPSQWGRRFEGWEGLRYVACISGLRVEGKLRETHAARTLYGVGSDYSADPVLGKLVHGLL
jgi:hypothetical protein